MSFASNFLKRIIFLALAIVTTHSALATPSQICVGDPGVTSVTRSFNAPGCCCSSGSCCRQGEGNCRPTANFPLLPTSQKLQTVKFYPICLRSAALIDADHLLTVCLAQNPSHFRDSSTRPLRLYLVNRALLI
jgi:hypothetical protein